MFRSRGEEQPVGRCPHAAVLTQTNDAVTMSRLKKDLKGLLVVHPAWYIRALITVVKPFIR